MKTKLIIIVLLIGWGCTPANSPSKQTKPMGLIDISSLDKSAEMLPEKQFWDIIDQSLVDNPPQAKQERQYSIS